MQDYEESKYFGPRSLGSGNRKVGSERFFGYYSEDEKKRYDEKWARKVERRRFEKLTFGEQSQHWTDEQWAKFGASIRNGAVRWKYKFARGRVLSFNVVEDLFEIYKNDPDPVKKRLADMHLKHILSKKQYEILKLRYYDGHSVMEVANKLEIRHQTIRAQEDRAYWKFRKYTPDILLEKK